MDTQVLAAIRGYATTEDRLAWPEHWQTLRAQLVSSVQDTIQAAKAHQVAKVKRDSSTRARIGNIRQAFRVLADNLSARNGKTDRIRGVIETGLCVLAAQEGNVLVSVIHALRAMTYLDCPNGVEWNESNLEFLYTRFVPEVKSLLYEFGEVNDDKNPNEATEIRLLKRIFWEMGRHGMAAPTARSLALYLSRLTGSRWLTRKSFPMPQSLKLTNGG